MISHWMAEARDDESSFLFVYFWIMQNDWLFLVSTICDASLSLETYRKFIEKWLVVIWISLMNLEGSFEFHISWVVVIITPNLLEPNFKWSNFGNFRSKQAGLNFKLWIFWITKHNTLRAKTSKKTFLGRIWNSNSSKWKRGRRSQKRELISLSD